MHLSRIDHDLPAALYAKAAYFNPGGSIKDRIAANIIDEAERSGCLKPDGTIVEATSGNTGMGSGLTGVLYVLDEPTTGLHPADTARLLILSCCNDSSMWATASSLSSTTSTWSRPLIGLLILVQKAAMRAANSSPKACPRTWQRWRGHIRGSVGEEYCK